MNGKCTGINRLPGLTIGFDKLGFLKENMEEKKNSSER